MSRDRNERLYGLELLRLAAAIAVLVWHYQHFMFVGHDEAAWNWSRLPFRWLLLPFYTYGYQGVELFWCISGFIFTWKYAGPIERNGLSIRRFAILRLSRLYPLHLATLLVVAGLQYLYFVRHGETFVYRFNDATHFILNLLFANWWGFQSGHSFNGPAWSISAEVLIYIFFFLLTRRAGAGWRVDLLALLGFSLAAPTVKALFGIKLAFTGAGTFFYVGALTCHLHDWIETRAARWRLAIVLGCVAVALLSAGLVAIHTLKIAGASLAMFPALLLAAQLAVRPASQWARGSLTGFGNLTYASYMLHFPLQLLAVLVLERFVRPVRPMVYCDWFMLAYFVAVLGTAFVVYRWIERPAQTLLRGTGRQAYPTRKTVAYNR